MTQRVFALLLLLSFKLFGAHYNSTIIELEAKLFPKMLMLCSQQEKSATHFEIVIIAKEHDYTQAKIFKGTIEETYTKKLMGKILEVKIVEFQKLESKPDGVIVFYHSSQELKKIAQWANKEKVPSLSYDPAHLEFGILGSLYIGAITKPYLNKETIKHYGFLINPYLLELSKFY